MIICRSLDGESKIVQANSMKPQISIGLLGLFIWVPGFVRADGKTGASGEFSVPPPTNSGKPCAHGGKYKVSLTFDDGPDKSLTPRVLDILKKKNIKATFFISSNHFPSFVNKTRPSRTEADLVGILRRIQKEGHVIGSHSYAHIDHAESSQEEITTNLNKNDKVLKNLGLNKIGMPFRFPYGGGWIDGHGSQAVMQDVKKRGFTPTHWDIDSWDWSKIKRKALPDSLLSQICSHGGGVILMHDVQQFEANNLAKIVDWIRASGHEIVPLSTIQKNKSPILGKFPSLADRATWYKSCSGGKIGDMDSTWPSCDLYSGHSSDRKRMGTAQ